MRSQVINLTVNGTERELLAKPGTTLLGALRDGLGLTAAKRGWAQGGCGACTIVVNGAAVPSCLIPVEVADGATVETLEGMASGQHLTPLQQAFVDGFATQCGFCTSGMLMSASALLAENPAPTRDEVAVAISGNVCRCTGYAAIIDAVLDAADRTRAVGSAAAD